MTRILAALALALSLSVAPMADALAASTKHATKEKPAAKSSAKLDALFAELDKVPDGAPARAVEEKIWDVWSHSGNAKVDRLLAEGTDAMAEENFDVAMERFNMVVAMAPDFVEGWNKRATLFFLIDEPERSLADIARVLALEPRHFGALSGMALIYRAKGDDVHELKALRSAVKANRHVPGARARIDELATKVEGEGI